MSLSKLFHVFTPQRDQPEELEKILVKRNALLDSAVEKIRESVISPDKHRLLFIGPRGMGKSYLVTLIHHRLTNQEDLTENMRFAWLNEDQTSTTFLHLLVRIYRKLANDYSHEFPIAKLESIRGKDPADAREMLGQSLIQHLEDRTVVLIIENLDAILAAMNEVEQRTWRGFIQDHPCFAILATAQGLNKNISSKSKPFFGFFDIHHLAPLNVDEATELLEKIAALNDNQPLADFIASPRGKARMRAIHHLSGGNPRLYLILSDFLTKDSLDNLVRLFEEAVDRQLTPYFQERMRWLSPQQQEIVQYLCQLVQPASVKAIAEGIFAKQNTVSSQLKQLREKGYLVSKSRGKESLYELAEPLMRLSFQVKDTDHRQPLTLIVDFMRVWYDRQDLENRLAKLTPGTWGRDYFEVAIRKIDAEGNSLRHSLMLACIDDIDWQKCDAHQLDELRGIAEETDNPKAWFKYGCACLMAKEFVKCVRAMSQVINASPESPEHLGYALSFRAASYRQLNNLDEAIADYTTALERSDSTKDPSLHLLASWRATVLQQKGNFQAAISDFTQAVDNWDGKSEDLAKTLVARADCHFSLGLCEDALSDLGTASEIPGISDEALATALANRASILSRLERFDEAANDYERVIVMPEISAAPLAQALNVRALCNMRDGELAAAGDDLELVLSMPSCPPIWMAIAHYSRSMLHLLSNNLQEAAADLSSAVETYEGYAPHALLELAQIYLELHQYEPSLDSAVRMLLWTKTSETPKEYDEAELGAILTKAAYGLRETPKKWKPAIAQIIPLLAEQESTSGLTTALVRNLEKLKNSDLNSAALDRWASDWESTAIEYPELQVGIRMLRAGVEWIKSKDDSALLDLVKEEREIVRQALELEPEKDK